jgi:F420H(2)-dependent quinone reductase
MSASTTQTTSVYGPSDDGSAPTIGGDLTPRWEAARRSRGCEQRRSELQLARGRKGLWPPRPGKWGTLRFSTKGRRSGKPWSLILGYYEAGPNLVSMAMNGWGAAEPAWWLNLQADPEAVVELHGWMMDAIAVVPA